MVYSVSTFKLRHFNYAGLTIQVQAGIGSRMLGAQHLP